MAVDLRSMRAAEVIRWKVVVQILVVLLHEVLHEIQRVAVKQAALDLHLCAPLADENGAGPLHATSTIVSAAVVFPVQHSNDLKLAQQWPSVVSRESAILNPRSVYTMEVDGTSHVWKFDVQHMILELLELVDLLYVIGSLLLVDFGITSSSSLIAPLLTTVSSAYGRDLVRTARALADVCAC